MACVTLVLASHSYWLVARAVWDVKTLIAQSFVCPKAVLEAYEGIFALVMLIKQ